MNISLLPCPWKSSDFSWHSRVFLLALLLTAELGLADTESTKEEIDLEGLSIGEIIIKNEDVFEDDGDLNPLFEFANSMHMVTRQGTVKSQLLFREGDRFSSQKLQESERILRSNPYLFDASISSQVNDQGDVDILVETRDNWTLFPEFKFSSIGGENETSFGIEEQNLFGTGTRLNIRRETDAERTSTVFEFAGRNIGEEHFNISYNYSDLSDGISQFLNLRRPFFSFDARWAAGISVIEDQRINSLFSLGERAARYRIDRDGLSISGGISTGLVDGWVKRLSLGYIYDHRKFEPVYDDDLAELAPENRKLSYPYISYRQIEDRYVEATNFNQIGRTEDVYLGTNFGMSLGYAGEDLSSGIDAWLVEGSMRRGFGSPEGRLVLFGTNLSTRVEAGVLKNAVLSASTEYYLRQTPERILYFLGSFRLTKDPDLDNMGSLGGENGLRGYPLNYLNAESTALFTIEQRFYTEYYPFKLYRVGAAVFFDAAYGIGEDPLGRDNNELLSNIGFGLRFGSTRSSSNRVFHLDFAIPLGGDSDELDSLQIRFLSKRRF